jgi:predicted GNAT family acetyltransferase
MWVIRAERGEYRYSALVDGERVAHAARVQVGDLVVVPHLYVDAPYRATGLDLDLARAICGDARDEGLTVLAGSVFMQRFSYLHPRFDAVLRVPYPGEVAMLAPLVEAAEGYEESRLTTGWPAEAGE